MKLTVIGCSGSMSGRNGPASGYLLQAEGEDPAGFRRTFSLALDFGPGVMGGLLNYLDPKDLDAIVLSHLHADHCADLVGMQVYRRWYPYGKLSRIPVFSPGDGADRTRKLADDPAEETYAGEFCFTAVKPGDVRRVGPFRLEFFAAFHTVPALCVRIEGPSAADSARTCVFAYTGDTDYCDSVVNAALDADFLLSEAAFEDGRDTVRGVHLTGLRAGSLAAAGRVKQVCLTHLQPWTDRERTLRDARKNFSGPVSLASPADVYPI
ncbi:MBL fold metallo-hydrolase [Arcanobacterium sp. S3PF19]|uniref:MBL fold metallo-hydrolase n=1 Tax=Arcanobacterium sp. S3PF19 TaxID=1219585 RepID=UPI00050EC2A0|nr:MBL fold metallo-hydrolase [Arcanobacterium sp. S3PF19]KGF06145.1 beta-lactamase [Arcanobacterium sp. S3PF19]